jgi:hypothetical protein
MTTISSLVQLTDESRRAESDAIVLRLAQRNVHAEGGYTDVEIVNGVTKYTLDGDLHREDGPALISAQGDENWYLNGLRHRVGGPAIVTRNGAQFYYVAGQRVTA